MIKIQSNLDELAEHIGAYMGMAEGIEQSIYLDGLMREAHRKTVPEFVKAAAANANRYNFSHMYEYGVAGITRGDRQFINPITQRARLWTDVMVGNGSRKNVTFLFRDAVRRVPKHTTESTGGVAQEELDKLRINQGKRYVFQHKAEVFEQGIDVNILPKKRDGMLFVPLRGTSIRANAKDQERGFTWARKLHINPGEMAGSVGQFNFYFFQWWSQTGGALMAQHMDRSVTEDIQRKEAELAGTRERLKSPRNTHINSTAQASKNKTRKQFTIWAQREDGFKEVVL